MFWPKQLQDRDKETRSAMAWLAAGPVARDIDVIVLDKDGTLIDFQKAWGGRLDRSITAIVEASRPALRAGDADSLRALLYATLGGDASDGSILPDGPYVSASIAETGTMAATVLYQTGIAWHRALALVEGEMMPVLKAPPARHEIGGIGDVRSRLALLRDAGIALAVATNDERAATLAGLDALGVLDLLDAVVCAGDPGLAAKPAPDGLLHIARTMGVTAERMAMVGDSVSDLLTGRAAEVGLTVGVLSGPATQALLEAHADVVVADIHALKPGT